MASKGNRVKKQETKQNPKVENVSLKSRVSSFFNFFREERFHKISGLFLILLSFFLLISFISYFATWKTDYDKVSGPWGYLLTHADIKVENLLGKFGAIASHQFMVNWFGISSFAFVLLSFLFGFRILFGFYPLPIRRTLAYSLFGLVFLSTGLGYFFSQSKLLFMGGAFGFEMNKWLYSSLGNIGTGLVIGFVFISFLVVAFNFNFRFSKKEDGEDPVLDVAENPELEMTETGNKFKAEPNPEIHLNEPEISSPIELELENEEEETGQESEDQISEEFLSVENTNDEEEGEKESSGTELQVEIPDDLIDAPAESAVPLAIVEGATEPGISSAWDNPEEGARNLVETLGEYDSKLDLSSYQFPSLDLLEVHASKNTQSREELIAELEANKNRIVETLGHYNIGIDKIKATVGPTVTLFEIVPQAGIRISKIKNLEDDIALSLSALGIRIIAPIPGKGTIGIEVPNQNAEVVSMRTVLASEKFQSCEYDLPIGLGKTISNEVYVADLAKMPHLLMAGATGQGKSVGLNAVLISLLYKKHPSQVKFVLVDPKKVELTLFKTIERHFLAKLPGEEEAIITDTRKVVNTLNSLCIEMDKRYELLKDAQVRNIREYNTKFVARKLNPNNGHRFLPFIVLVIDEFADLIMTAGKEIEAPIARLAQLARAIGIHLIIATQRPSVNIITGTIKANFPARLAFRVTSKIDSRTILDTGGADQLIGRGDMLLSTGADVIRLQCAFVDTPEVDKITEYIGGQRGYPEAFLLPEYVGEGEDTGSNAVDPSERDPLFEEAARMVVQHQQGSASLLQRRLKLGYNRAGRLIDQLEAAGIIGPFEGSKAREVRVKDMVALEQNYLSPTH